MGASKIVDEAEVLRWFEEGRTYAWMTEQYREKYNIETAPSLWGNFRRRRGLDRRIQRDDDLIPWAVNREHRWKYPLAMLRAEARRRAGADLRPDDASRLRNWLDEMRASGSVVHYDPETEEGFFYVPRRVGIDRDLIREPVRKTTLKHRER
jgi:hypothetical protein